MEGNDAPNTSIVSSQQRESILIRHIRYSDISKIASIAATEYFDSDLNTFLCPRRHEYPHHVTRHFSQMIETRFLNPRNIGFVAVKASKPQEPLGYAQFIRLGNDRAALHLISQQSSFWLTLQQWWSRIRIAVTNFIWPDRAVDRNAKREFLQSTELDMERYWMSPAMKAKYENRWHAQSVVVSSAYQRRGIGRLLMAEVLHRAQDEGVVVGLEASTEGEKLYRNLGFELRGPFSMIIGLSAGGIMMWTPASSHL
ncbi:hypothetical protein N7492_006298 [Penicillium capsulatum]|uniref:N-acetyltransferase domain-containing protein n=1 Tax=Penicillium capsulatum TaxID=69766 RepID=A0A9W9LM01_9EURO|nr:hypothetical protein N7492_006298 [Penicillium capsulatum]KAJ6108948.1 hypothetical protein N7512_008785 [Penicillium capsulatum]